MTLALVSASSNSSAATALWTKQWGSTSNDQAYSVAFDGEGSIYVGGYTRGTIGGQTNPGGDAGLLNKFTPDGTFVWARIYGSGFGNVAASTGEGGTIVSDGASAIYAAGRAAGPFDGEPAPGSGDFYLRKFDSNGNRAWTRIWGSSSVGDTFFDVVMGGGGNVYLAGFAFASVYGQPYAGSADPVVFRSDPQGNRISTWEWGTSANEPASAIAVDPSGNSYVAGAYTSGCFLTKLNASGGRLWTSFWGTGSWPQVATDSDGNVYAVTTATGVVGDQQPIGGNDANITKFSPGGAMLWTRTWGSTGSDGPAGKPCIGPDGNIYVPGGTTGSFDGQTNSGGNEGFVSVFSPSGTRLWTKFIGTAQDDSVSAAAFDSQGNLLVCGWTTGTFPGQTNFGARDLFLMKWSLTNAPVPETNFLFVGNWNNTITRYTPDGTPSTFASSSLASPVGLAFDRSGNLYAANRTANTITKFAPDGTPTTFASSNLNLPSALAFDRNGNLYAANHVINTITKFAPDGTPTLFANSGLSTPQGMAFDSSGNLYAANGGNNTITKYAPDGTSSTFANSGLNNPRALAFDRNGNLYAASIDGNTVTKYTPGGTPSMFITSGLTSPNGLAFDGSGNLYVVNTDINTIKKFDSTGHDLGVFATSGLSRPAFLAFSSGLAFGTIQLSAVPTTNINEQVAWQYTPTINGVGYTFGLSNAPAGMTVNPTNSTISWMPTEAQGPGTNANITFVVYQSGVPVASTNFTVVVNEVNVAPVLTVPGTQTIDATTTLTVTNTATDPDIPANSMTFALVSAPSGVVLNTNTGVLTWTPTMGQGPSTNTITVSVTDNNPWAVNSQQLSATNSFIVIVKGLIAPSFTVQPVSQVVGAGQSVTFSATAEGYPAPTYQWRLNGVNISGATSATLEIPSTSITDIGLYDVVIANAMNTNSSAVVSLGFIDLKMLAGVYVTGPVGANYRIDATPALAPTNWVVLTNVTITAQPFIYIDYASPTNSKQFYRAVPQ